MSSHPCLPSRSTPASIRIALLALVVSLAAAATAKPQPAVAPLPLTWAPPALESPSVVMVTNSNRSLKLDKTRDYIVLLPGAVGNDLQSTPLQVSGGVTVYGGRNVTLIGGEIRHDQAVDDGRAMYLKSWTGTMFVEGVAFGGEHLYEVINVDTRSPGAKLYLQNIRVDDPILAIVHRKDGKLKHEGGDAFQTWGGPQGGLYIDGFTVAESTYQGLFLQPDQFGKHAPVEAVIKRFNIGPYTGTRAYPAPYTGSFGKGAYFFWQSHRFPIELIDCYVSQNPDKPFGKSLWPDVDNQQLGCRIHSDQRGEYAVWPAETLITGQLRQGLPPGGDFVPAGTVGVGYVSPGYLDQP